jgi:hypothetical protein
LVISSRLSFTGIPDIPEFIFEGFGDGPMLINGDFIGIGLCVKSLGKGK